MNAQEVALLSQILALATSAILQIVQIRKQAEQNNDQDTVTNLAAAHNNFQTIIANAQAVIGNN